MIIMNSLIDFFERLLTNFTWSRLTFTFVLLFLLISAIFAYEAYTQHFALERLDKQVKIFDQLVTLSEKLNLEENDKVLNESFKSLVAGFNSQVNYKSYLGVDGASLTTRYSFPEWFTKSIYILLPWLVLSFFLIVTMTSGRASAMGGIMFVSSFFLLIGLILPSFKETPWVMKWAYPWGAMIISVFLIVIFDRRKKGI